MRNSQVTTAPETAFVLGLYGVARYEIVFDDVGIIDQPLVGVESRGFELRR